MLFRGLGTVCVTVVDTIHLVYILQTPSQLSALLLRKSLEISIPDIVVKKSRRANFSPFRNEQAIGLLFFINFMSPLYELSKC